MTREWLASLANNSYLIAISSAPHSKVKLGPTNQGSSIEEPDSSTVSEMKQSFLNVSRKTERSSSAKSSEGASVVPQIKKPEWPPTCDDHELYKAILRRQTRKITSRFITLFEDFRDSFMSENEFNRLVRASVVFAFDKATTEEIMKNKNSEQLLQLIFNHQSLIFS